MFKALLNISGLVTRSRGPTATTVMRLYSESSIKTNQTIQVSWPTNYNDNNYY